MRTVLHVGCGKQGKETLPALNWEKHWREVRVDIDPEVEPDIVDDIVTLSKVADRSAHFLFSKHNIEHLDYHDVPVCLKNFNRVLDDNGFAIIRTPDLASICEYILNYGAGQTVHTCSIDDEENPVGPLDMLFGASWAIEAGNHFMAHRTAFTAESLAEKLKQAGFEHVETSVDKEILELRVVAIKKIEGNLFWKLRGKTPPVAA